MSRYNHLDEENIREGLIVQEFGCNDMGLLDWIAHESLADTTEINT